MDSQFNVVTGAFGFTGKYIAARLLGENERVRTLTGHPGRTTDPRIEVAPLNFSDPHGLTESLSGASVLYNTYWVRFAHGDTTHATAVADTKTLIEAAARAGVGRIVHVSITQPSLTSALPYFRGKAELEEVVKASGLSYAILRPAVIFGPEDILINNIAWLLRHYPVFAIPSSGEYRIQPMFVEDMARLAIESARRNDNFTVDAVGPETFTYNELVDVIARVVGSRSRIVHLSPAMVLMGSHLLGMLTKDVVLTRHEIDGLMADLLVSNQPPTGSTRLTDWLAQQHKNEVGRQYASELARHYRKS
jgi:NADH dehydrogenase